MDDGRRGCIAAVATNNDAGKHGGSCPHVARPSEAKSRHPMLSMHGSQQRKEEGVLQSWAGSVVAAKASAAASHGAERCCTWDTGRVPVSAGRCWH